MTPENLTPLMHSKNLHIAFLEAKQLNQQKKHNQKNMTLVATLITNYSNNTITGMTAY